MRMVLMAAALAAFAAPAKAQDPAPTPPDGFTWYVLNELNRFYLDIDDPTNRPTLTTEVPPGVLVPLEINGDGRTDWLINWPESAQFCGTGGCLRSLYISGEEGFTRAFDRQALRFEVKTIDGERRVEAALHHLECSQGQDECLRAWAWDPAAGRLQERASSDGVSRMSGTSPVDLGEEPDGTPRLPPWTPPQLEQMRFESRVWCPAVNEPDGRYLGQALLYDVPDLTGDGLRDWIYAPEDGCGSQAETGFEVWVTTGRGPGPYGQGGAVALAFTAAPERWAEYEVSDRPATLLVTAPCEEGTDCAGVPLRWDPRSGRLVE